MTLNDWQAREEVIVERLSIEPAQRLLATLGHDVSELEDGGCLPAQWQWLYFTPAIKQNDLSADGHGKKGDFLPPTTLSRRMFAAVRTHYHSPLLIGEQTTRKGIVTDVQEKQGKSGNLVFAKVDYQFFQNDELCIKEEQTIVYRGEGAEIALPEVLPFAKLPDNSWEKIVTPDPVLLFRFSALTFNAHRIHYDRRYAREEESYPALVVHAPLSSILLLDLVASRNEKRIISTEFKAQSPIFDSMPLRLCVSPVSDSQLTLKAERCDGVTGLSGEVFLE